MTLADFGYRSKNFKLFGFQIFLFWAYLMKQERQIWIENDLMKVSSFDKVASEEKMFLEINQSETRIVCGGHVF